MTKLKQLTPYLLLVVLSFFVANFVLKSFLNTGLEINSMLSVVTIAIIALVIYGVYLIINLILNKILSIRVYKGNKIVKLFVFFLIYTIGWIVSPTIVLLLMIILYGGI